MDIHACGIRSIVAFGALACIGCTKYSAVTGSAQQIGLEIQPATAQVAVGGRLTFSAVVTGAANATVNWSVVEPGGGAIDGAGLYTAPQTPGAFHVRATTPVDPTVQATAAVTVTPPATVAVAPASGVVHSCQTLLFSATVTGASDTSVTWSVREGASGGQVDANGLYTAPNVAGTYHVVATSKADPASSGIAQVEVTDLVLSVAVSPSTTGVIPGGTKQFTATVTTTCGAFSAARAVAGADAPPSR